MLVEMQNGTATLEDNLAVYYKTKQSYHTIQQLHSLVIYPKELKIPAHYYVKGGFLLFFQISTMSSLIQQVYGKL